MQQFRELKVWQKSHALVLNLYRLTTRFPGEERFGLTSQLRRAAVSVPTSIAEGTKRRGKQDYARFLNIAKGSLSETEYLVMLGCDLGYLRRQETDKRISEISETARMLYALRCKVEIAPD